MKRTNVIPIKVSDEERSNWHETAGRFGRSVSDLVRNHMNALSQGIVDPAPIIRVPSNNRSHGGEAA